MINSFHANPIVYLVFQNNPFSSKSLYMPPKVEAVKAKLAALEGSNNLLLNDAMMFVLIFSIIGFVAN